MRRSSLRWSAGSSSAARFLQTRSIDTIRAALDLILARGHVALVEKLAEDIADRVLRDPRVFSVNIRIEKLDVVPGSVGIEIKRERRKSSANVHQLFPGLAETGKSS